MYTEFNMLDKSIPNVYFVGGNFVLFTSVNKKASFKPVSVIKFHYDGNEILLKCNWKLNTFQMNRYWKERYKLNKFFY